MDRQNEAFARRPPVCRRSPETDKQTFRESQESHLSVCFQKWKISARIRWKAVKLAGLAALLEHYLAVTIVK